MINLDDNWFLPEYPGAPLEGGYFDSEDVPAVEPRIEPVQPAMIVRARGRHTKFNELVRETIIEKVRNGASVTAAARAAGITGSTLNNWLNDPRPEYADFAAELDEVRALAFVACEQIIKTTRPLDWLLKGPGRFFSEDGGNGKQTPAWADPTHKIESRSVSLNGNVQLQGAPALDTSDLPLEDLEAIEAMLMRAQAKRAIPIESKAIELATDAENVLTIPDAIAQSEDPDAAVEG